ncbi:MAG: GntR family transcriptional regulator [Pseudorhodobacter sp.]
MAGVQQRAEGGKAQRVYLLLRNAILRGDHAVGQALPGELRLAEFHAVSRVTIRRAIDVLVEEGLIERRAGSGNVVVAQGMNQIVADLASLMPHLVEMGQGTTARLLSYSYELPPPPVAEALRLAPGQRAQRAVRVRQVADGPFSYLTTHVPEDIANTFSESDLATTPLFRLLERSGVTVGQARQSVSATLSAPDVAEALEIAVGSALILLERVVLDTDGRGIEHLSALYRPDRFRLEMMLNRVGQSSERHWEPVIAGDTGRGDET